MDDHQPLPPSLCLFGAVICLGFFAGGLAEFICLFLDKSDPHTCGWKKTVGVVTTFVVLILLYVASLLLCFKKCNEMDRAFLVQERKQRQKEEGLSLNPLSGDEEEARLSIDTSSNEYIPF